MFGGRKITHVCLILKINTKTMEIIVDEKYSDTPLEDIQDELPDCSPRYVIYNWKITTKDNRVTNPLCFIYYCPEGSNTKENILYCRSKGWLQNELKIQKSFECVDLEELTDEWVMENFSKA